MESSQAKITKFQESEVINEAEFQKYVYAPDQIESIDWSKWNKKNVKMTKVSLPKINQFDQNDKFAITLDNILTAKECQKLIEITEMNNYSEALVNTGMGNQQKMQDFRYSDRCIIDSKNVADVIWKRIKPFVPLNMFERQKSIGVNERLRFLRYDKDMFFKPHCDGSYLVEGSYPKQESQITLQLYLNEGMEGGDTTFMGADENVGITPKIGKALLFVHDIKHEGSILIKGRKYAIRTDIMYQELFPQEQDEGFDQEEEKKSQEQPEEEKKQSLEVPKQSLGKSGSKISPKVSPKISSRNSSKAKSKAKVLPAAKPKNSKK